MKHIFNTCLLLIAVGMLFAACSQTVKIEQTLHQLPSIFPDYAETTIPYNIAPLSFEVQEEVEEARALFETNGKTCVVKASNKVICMDTDDWKELLTIAKGGKLTVTVQGVINGHWTAFAPFTLSVSTDAIDPYLAYRLIEPGYERWQEMGIYQRCLENFEQTEIANNRNTGYNCMNCHSFCQQNPDKMLLHMRKNFGGTFLVDGDKIEKLNTKTDQTISALVYPSWHPTGNYVAFSVNETKQLFHTTNPNRTEVFDYRSDVVVYDVKKHQIVTCPQLFSKQAFETFPSFSADGRTLYFCSADSLPMPDKYKEVRYSLCSISFDPVKRTFGNRVDTLYNAHTEKKSVSFPRVSPDGRHLLFTRCAYGNFSIWHKDADLYIVDLHTRKVRPLTVLNSNDVDSYHSWSSNSRWVVFSSRRLDGLYTRPFIAHIDAQGVATKPFLLPQEDPNQNKRLMKSYNIPEFIRGKVKHSPYEFSEIAKREAGIDIQMGE